MTRVIGVRFRNVGKIYYFSPKDFDICVGDHVIPGASKFADATLTDSSNSIPIIKVGTLDTINKSINFL